MVNGSKWVVLFAFGEGGEGGHVIHFSAQVTRQGAIEDARLHLTGIQLREVSSVRICSIKRFEEYDTD